MDTGAWIGDVAPEPDPPQPGHWIARPQKPFGALQIGASAAFLGNLPNLLHLLFKPWLGEAASWLTIFVIITIAFVALGLIALRRRRARRRRTANLALMDASFGEQFAMEITIVANGKRLGSDVGVAWFADGVMGFSGSASSYVLAAWDVEVARKAIPARDGMPAVPQGALVLRNASVPAYLTATPVTGTTKSFRERFTRFEKESASQDAERFWPPLVPYEESPAVERGDSTGAIRA